MYSILNVSCCKCLVPCEVHQQNLLLRSWLRFNGSKNVLNSVSESMKNSDGINSELCVCRALRWARWKAYKVNATSNTLENIIMAVSKHARKRAVAAGVVIAAAMIAGTFSVPVHATELQAALAPSPTSQMSRTSDSLTPSPLLLVTGLLLISIASFVQNGVTINLF